MADPLDAALAEMDERLEPEDAPDPGPPSEEPEAPAEEEAVTAPEQQELPDEEPTDEGPTREERLQAYLDKYGGDLEKAYEATVHAQQRIGQQDYELGQLRKLVEETDYEPQAPQTQINQPVVDWFEEQVDTNPYGAAVWAQQNDPSGILYNRAMDAWYNEAPRQAAAFERQQEIAQVRAEFGQQVQQTQAPLEAQEMARAFRAASEKHPEIGDNLGELLQTAAQHAPVVTQSLIERARQSDYTTRVQIFDGIIALAKGHQAGAAIQANQEAADQNAARARQLKQGGGVATQTQAVAAEQVSADEQWLRDNFDKHLTPE